MSPPSGESFTDNGSSFQPWRGGVALVHLVEVTREKVRFLAALGPTDLDDHALALVRVARNEERLQLLVEAHEILLGGGDLAAHLVAVGAGRIGEHLARRRQVGLTSPIGAVGLDDGQQFLVASRHGAQERLVGEHGGIGEGRFERGQLVLQPAEPLDHG